MKEIMIKKYVDMLSIDDVVRFARMNNVDLNDDEVKTIYNTVKNEWKTIIYGDYKDVLNKYKNNFPVDKLNKIERLIISYKDKYRNYI